MSTIRTAEAILDDVLFSRGVTRSQAAAPLSLLPAPAPSKDIDAACSLILDAMDRDEPILIVGDYDCDGATATAIAIRGLYMLGHARVDFCVPNRLVHGYGLGRALLKDVILKRRERPALLITVDNGIAAHDGIAAAKAEGLRVIVTDHHLPGHGSLPDADAILDPSVPGDGMPSTALCGAGVMFYLLLALRARMRKENRFNPLLPEPDLSILLDLVALGTVADVVPLDNTNRILVAAGLRRIRSGKAHLGIRALFRVARREASCATSSDLGFSIGPRINAAGRLEDIGSGIRCLICDDEPDAMRYAMELEGVNQRRKSLQETMVEQAQELLQDTLQSALQGDPDQPSPPAYVLHDPRWHEGVVGLVASRVREETNRPVFAFADASNPGEMKGSGRSIPGFHLRDALAEIHAAHPGLITRFGGHAMAAGLTLPARHLDRFREAFLQVSRSRLNASLLSETTLTDGPIRGDEVTRELARLFEGIPWGQAFHEPLFEIEGRCIEWRRIGDKSQFWSLKIEVDQVIHRAVCFSPWADEPPEHIRALARISLNHFRGESDVNIMLEQPRGKAKRRMHRL
jgi:single-stranded-DNA-specific exonuclease